MSAANGSLESLKEVVAHHWGFTSLRPHQEAAMQAVLDGRDSLVVLPTGGGKSLCYQAPAVVRGDTTVVISPLISLMKDQVDALRSCGIPATQLDSSQTSYERSAHEQDVLQGAVRLLFVSPERLVLGGFHQFLQRIRVRSFAIDEAHCISHWGHDFRPEYRQLKRLRELFPEATLHGYTATATEQVRRDIIDQLGLKDPEVLVGNFDRPNLAYRIVPRMDLEPQVKEVLDRHADESGIIYCIKRKDVDSLTAWLKDQGYSAMPYHAGMGADDRKRTQDAFRAEQCNLVVATVAFGMGIDRSNVRFVLHTGMPKSIEHYQQETGRAGRDGLEAECVLLYSGGDVMTWKWMLEKSAGETNVDASFLPNALKHLDDMDRYCRGAVCRHRALVEHFGQTLEAESCAACDICLEDAELAPDALLLAQKILSCVARVKERFGVNHVVSVLRGENLEAVRKWGHEQLSTFGILHDQGKPVLRNWIYQLISQNVLVKQGDPYPTLSLNAGSWEVMKGQRTVRLLQPVTREKRRTAKADTTSWEGVDRTLFEVLKGIRTRLAEDRQVPPYVIFSDATLRELGRVRPSSPESMLQVYGIGSQKLKDLGPLVLQTIRDYCRKHLVSQDNTVSVPRRPEPPPVSSRPANAVKLQAYQLFREGTAVEDVIHQTGRSRGTVMDYLADWVREEKPASVKAWVSDDLYRRIAEAAGRVGMEKLKPIFLALGETVPYDAIRVVVSHLQATASPAAS